MTQPLRDFPHGYEMDYEPASREFSLGMARRMIERLYGASLERIELAGPEALFCHDCRTAATLLQYGHVAACRRCALLRRRVANMLSRAA